MKTLDLLKQYRDKKNAFENLKELGLSILQRELTKNSIKVASVESRVKEFDSFKKKSSDKSLTSPFEEMSDIVGLRVICHFQSDIDKISEIINNTFKVVKEDNKEKDSSIDKFDYTGIHFDVKLRKEDSNEYNDIIFEIQLRTICQHAWDTISWTYFYKGEKEIPNRIKRDFHAINGLLYVADTHFEMIKIGT